MQAFKKSLNKSQEIKKLLEMEIEPGLKHYTEDEIHAEFSIKSAQKLEEIEKAREENPVVKHGEVEFRNVSAKYLGGENYVTKNFSLKIPAGKKIGIVGRTGSGKSTLIKLLWRYLEYEKGEIYIDGVEIKNYDLKDLRRSLNIIS